MAVALPAPSGAIAAATARPRSHPGMSDDLPCHPVRVSFWQRHVEPPPWGCGRWRRVAVQHPGFGVEVKSPELGDGVHRRTVGSPHASGSVIRQLGEPATRTGFPARRQAASLTLRELLLLVSWSAWSSAALMCRWPRPGHGSSAGGAVILHGRQDLLGCTPDPGGVHWRLGE
jgi:hypothetical protein